MSWEATETTIRAAVEQLRDQVNELQWALGIKQRPTTRHTVYTILMDSTVPMEIGANLHSSPYPDEVRGRVQFDVYSPIGETPSEALADADAIRGELRGLRTGPIHFLTPDAPRFLGRDDGWFRWVVDCPFKAQEV
jgi:hypothetical protein